jgi:iron uptake system component EfeO
MVRRLIAVRAATAVICAGAIGLLSGCSGSSGSAATGGPVRITVASEHCGAGWIDPRTGQQTFVLANTDIVSGEVFLVDAGTGAVYAYVDDVAPGATANLRINLAPGRYSFRCAMSDAGVARGVTVVVNGVSRGGARPVRSVTDNDLIPVAKAYQSYVSAALPGLRGLVGVLAADIRDGRLAAARADWLPAHLAYERLGAAYGAFGDADSAINGLTAGLAYGVSDTHFTGFHRIEYGLWHGQTATELTPFANRLVADVATLPSVLAGSSVATLDIAIRSHEIAENALQFDLTGQTDYGSGTSLASVAAELDGTTELMTLMRPILAPRYPELSTAGQALQRAKSDVGAELVGGRWARLAALPRESRERIDADLSGLSALLAPIASIAEPRVDS